MRTDLIIYFFSAMFYVKQNTFIAELYLLMVLGKLGEKLSFCLKDNYYDEFCHENKQLIYRVQTKCC